MTFVDIRKPENEKSLLRKDQTIDKSFKGSENKLNKMFLGKVTKDHNDLMDNELAFYYTMQATKNRKSTDEKKYITFEKR